MSTAKYKKIFKDELNSLLKDGMRYFDVEDKPARYISRIGNYYIISCHRYTDKKFRIEYYDNKFVLKCGTVTARNTITDSINLKILKLYIIPFICKFKIILYI